MSTPPIPVPSVRPPAVPNAVPNADSTGARPGGRHGLPTASSPRPAGGIVRNSALMAIAALASRITGLLSKIVIFAVLGTGVLNDVYTLANTLPNIVFELLIGGVLTSVAIPLLARAQRTDADGGQAYTQQLLTLGVVALAAATVLAVAAAPLLIRTYLSSSFQGDPQLATELAYLLLPQIFFYGIAALFGAILNSKERFAAAAWAPVTNNVLVIVMAIGLLYTSGGLIGQSLTVSQYLVLGIGTTAGIILQALVMIPALLRSGFRFRWRLKVDKRMGEAGQLAGWAVVYVLVSQVGYAVMTHIASRTSGGISTLFLANLLFQTPYGILGVSVLTAIMPRMSRHAAAGELERVKDDMSLANRLSAVALLPVSAALLALAGAVGVVIAGYGRVNLDSALLIGVTCGFLAIGLVPLSMTLVQMRVFYAMKDGRTPVIINAIMVAVRVPLMFAATTVSEDLLIPGLALSTAVSYLVGAVVGEIWLRSRLGPMGTARVLRTIGKMTVASVVGGLAAWGAIQYVWGGFPDDLISAAGQLAVGAVVGLTVILLVALLLRVEEFQPLIRRLRSMLRARPAPAGTVTQTDIDLPDVVSREQVMTPMTTPQQPGPAPDPQLASQSTSPGGVGRDSQRTVVTGSPVPPAGPVPTAGSAPAAAPTLAPGAMVGGRYRLVSLVAGDAYGNRFWRAKDTVLPRDMAVTLLPDGPNTNATVTRTLRAGRLHHIGLPQTLDLGTENGMSYVVGQWVDGATLTDLLAGGPLESEVASQITAKVADAVTEAHRNGISLGAIHPSLVRVNFDGQVRFSHVLSYAGATPDQDIRAIGGLLYLMLTATYPLPQNGMSPALPPAPTSGGREVTADQVRPGTSPGLAGLAERTLHPEGPSGVRSAGAIATLLHQTDVNQAVLQTAAVQPDEPTLTPAQQGERKIRKERRIKLGIAGAMLLALSVLLAIVIGSVATRVVDSLKDDPSIYAGDALDAAVPSLTPTSAGGGETVQQTAPGATAEQPTAGAATSAPGVPAANVNVPVIAADVYDPDDPSGDKDYISYADRVFDGDPTSAWQTYSYKQNFAPGGYRTGVGLLVTFDHPVSPTSITVTTTTPGITVQIRASDGNGAATLDQTTVLAVSTIGDAPASIALTGAPVSANLIVLVTGLVQPAGDAQWEGTVSEISVTAAG